MSTFGQDLAALAQEVDLVETRTTGTLARLGGGPVADYGQQVDAGFLIRAGVVRGENHVFDGIRSANTV